MENTEISKSKIPAQVFLVLAVAGFLLLVFLIYALVPAKNFETEKIVVIEKGETLSQIAENLKGNGIIRREFPFKILVMLAAGEEGAIFGEYLFKKPQNAFMVSRRITGGEYGFNALKITFPEGSTVAQIAEIIKNAIPGFAKEEFLRTASEDEGYLFPDTYFFPVNIKPAETAAALKDNFIRKIAPLERKIATSGKTEKEIVIMASIIEKEAANETDRRIISGILWKRLRIGMPLQVDAAFLYTLGKRSDELTEDDLKKDSPYNTYTRRGLPPGPISNPGLDSILAALEPEESSYLYYLSDKNGETHYAKSFDGHRANKAKYLP